MSPQPQQIHAPNDGPPHVEELLKDVSDEGRTETPTATRFAPVIAATDRPPFTQYHSKYFAFELTKRVGSDQADKLAQSLSNATVDLNPHQVEAALFGSEEAFRELYAKKPDSLAPGALANLRARLASVCQRTLRKQVLEYVRYPHQHLQHQQDQ